VAALPGMRRWQVDLLGEPLLKAVGKVAVRSATSSTVVSPESPYRDA
jgi:hypothetical protein